MKCFFGKDYLPEMPSMPPARLKKSQACSNSTFVCPGSNVSLSTCERNMEKSSLVGKNAAPKCGDCQLQKCILKSC